MAHASERTVNPARNCRKILCNFWRRLQHVPSRLRLRGINFRIKGTLMSKSASAERLTLQNGLKPTPEIAEKYSAISGVGCGTFRTVCSFAEPFLELRKIDIENCLHAAAHASPPPRTPPQQWGRRHEASAVEIRRAPRAKRRRRALFEIRSSSLVQAGT